VGARAERALCPFPNAFTRSRTGSILERPVAGAGLTRHIRAPATVAAAGTVEHFGLVAVMCSTQESDSIDGWLTSHAPGIIVVELQEAPLAAPPPVRIARGSAAAAEWRQTSSVPLPGQQSEGAVEDLVQVAVGYRVAEQVLGAPQSGRDGATAPGGSAGRTVSGRESAPGASGAGASGPAARTSRPLAPSDAGAGRRRIEDGTSGCGNRRASSSSTSCLLLPEAAASSSRWFCAVSRRARSRAVVGLSAPERSISSTSG